MTKFLRLQVVMAVEMGRYRLCRYRYNMELLTTVLAIYNESKVTNAWWSINQCNEKLYFHGQPHSFQGFFQTFPYPWPFSKLFKAWKISILNSMTFQTSRICTNPEQLRYDHSGPPVVPVTLILSLQVQVLLSVSWMEFWRKPIVNPSKSGNCL